MSNTQKTDHELLQACIEGNATAFETLVERYQSVVCAITYSGTGRFEASEELAQETFLLAWKNLGQLQDAGKFQAWICRIARNTVQNWLRKLQRDVSRSAASLDVAAEQASSDFEPAQIALEREQAEVVDQALGHIPEKYRESLVLFYREEKSTREVAERLGLSENSARQRIARARNMLRDQVAAMVETTLTKSRPGKAFTGMVMAAIAGKAIQGTVATAVVGTAGGSMGVGLSALFTGIGGKVAVVVLGAALIAGGVFLNNKSGKDVVEPPPAVPEQLVGEADDNVSENNPSVEVVDRPDDGAASIDADIASTTNLQAETPDPVPSLQGQSAAENRPQSESLPVLSGRLTDIETGAPIVQARIDIYSTGGGGGSRAMTDQNGVYSFVTLQKNGTYNIRLSAEEYIIPASWEGPRETIELHQAKSATRDYALAKGCKVLIKAVNEAGQPIKRVNFHAVYVSDEFGRGPKDTVRTNADGLTFVGGLRPDEYLVVGSHPDYALVGQKVKFDQPKEVNTITFTLEVGIEVAGLAACSDDLPASGWQIRAEPIWWHSSRSWRDDYPVAEDGTFLFKHVLPGLHRLEVYIPKVGGSRGIWSTEVNLPPETGFLDFHIPRPSPFGRVSLSGEVVFLNGDNDGGFWIHLTGTTGHSGGVYLQAGERRFTITDLVPGLYDLEFTLDGHRTDYKNVKVPRENLLLEVSIPEQNLLRARVVDKNTHEPVTNFKVRRVGQDTWRQVSDPNGLFEFANRGPDPRRFAVRAGGYREVISQPITPDASDPTLIEMGGEAMVSGQIVNIAGEPISGATVDYRYQRSGGEAPDQKHITETDDQGRFAMHVTSRSGNREWFVFRHPDYARVIEQLIVSGDHVPDIHVVMPVGGTVQGYAHDWQGRRLGDTTIYFMDERSFSYWKQNRARLAKVTTNSEGFYRINHLPAEICYAFYDNPDRQLGVVQSAVLPISKQTREFNIGGPWRASGRLIRNNEPLGNARLRVTFEQGVVQGFQANTITNAHGEFSFCGLPTGARSLYCAIPGTGGRDAWVNLGTLSFFEGRDQSLGDFELTLAEVRVELSFVNAAIPTEEWDVTITAYNDTGFWGRRVGELLPRTDTSDPFVFGSVPSGEFEVVASRRDYPSVRYRLTVTPEQDSHSVPLVIPAGSAMLSGRILSSSLSENPASLMLRNTDQTLTQNVVIDEQGWFHFEDLPAGHYIIGRANSAKARSSILYEVSLRIGEDKTVEIPVDSHDTGHAHDGYLIVSLVTEQGVPLATSDIWLEQHGKRVEPHFNQDDSKSFMGKPGSYTLHANYPGFKPVRTSIEIKSRHERATQSILKPVFITMKRE